MEDDNGIEKDFAALEHMRRARMNFGDRICAASVSQADDVLESLRLENMFEFAEFYFALKAIGFCGPDDITVPAEMHNRRIDKLLRDAVAMRQRKLSKDRLLNAIFTGDTRPRLEQCWRETPGALDQSNLARFLLPQMSSETTRKLVVAAEAAGFLTRRETAFGTIVLFRPALWKTFSASACARCARPSANWEAVMRLEPLLAALLVLGPASRCSHAAEGGRSATGLRRM